MKVASTKLHTEQSTDIPRYFPLTSILHLGLIAAGASWGTAVEQRNSTKGVTNTVRSLQPLGSIPSYLAQIEALTFADRLPRARPLTTGHGLVEIANKQKIELPSGFLISPFRFRFNIRLFFFDDPVRPHYKKVTYR